MLSKQNLKPDTIKLLSLNVRGLSNFKKRRAIFSWCRKQKADLIFLQETHSCREREAQWKKEWGAEILFSHGRTNARGVAVFIKKGFDIDIRLTQTDSIGRLILLKAVIKEENYTIANIYRPNKDADAVKFYHNLSNLLRTNDFGNEENIIMGGDFNCPLNVSLDKKGGIPIPRRYVVKSIEEIRDEFSLHDIWRIKNPNQQSFTWGRCSPFVFCRLDYWLISDKLHDLVSNVDILPSIKSDHSAIFLELEEIKENSRGPSYWKLNTALLANEEHKNMINNKLSSWLEEAKDLKDHRSSWDWINFNIRTDSMIFSKRLSKIRHRREEELTCKYKESLAAFQDNPCDNTRTTMESCKNELESMYDKKVEGIIIRARARWHEHGEKNSKYFLNLEKRNHIKKHIRKLHISGAISTDPLSIINSQKQFYTKLYSSCKTKLDTPEATAFFENPNLPRVSSEASNECEGRITTDECQNIIKTFPLGKTPGNDGLPIEFYNVFWPSIGELLVKCFSEAYDRKEMFNSQRQGVITLIEKTGKDRTYLENWRPISLTSVDAKIASKVIATRIIKILPEIIHSNQTGYVSGRYIGEAARF